MEKILITGSKGQLGSELTVLSNKYDQFEWIFRDKQELDLCDLNHLKSELSIIDPRIIINCAAHTAVDRAESELELSDLLNHQAVAVMAEWSYANNCQFVHISTDYVFDGTASSALTEIAPTNPINVYGVTKLAGEEACLKQNPNSIIIRTSWVYSSFGNNFVKKMSRLLQEKESLNIIDDQIGSPTYAADLAQAVMTILTHAKWEPGIYHFSNEGEISWFEFAIAIQKTGNFNCKVCGIPSSAYPTSAKRPKYSLLDKTKIKNTFGVEVPGYMESLRECLMKMALN